MNRSSTLFEKKKKRFPPKRLDAAYSRRPAFSQFPLLTQRSRHERLPRALGASAVRRCARHIRRPKSSGGEQQQQQRGGGGVDFRQAPSAPGRRSNGSCRCCCCCCSSDAGSVDSHWRRPTEQEEEDREGAMRRVRFGDWKRKNLVEREWRMRRRKSSLCARLFCPFLLNFALFLALRRNN